MLANTENQQSQWNQNLLQHSNVLPLTTINHGEYKSSIKKLKSVENSSSHTFQIVFDSIQGIPVPQKILHKASRLNSSIGCVLSVTLFDIESGTFFGKTWKSTRPIPMIRKIKGKDGKSASGIDNQRAMLIGNKLNLELHDQVTIDNLVRLFSLSYANFRVDGFEDHEDLSGGWTIMYLFDPKRGGISNSRESSTEDTHGNEYKTAPLFVGTPRILPFISHTLLDSISGYSAMTICPGTSLKYYLIERPDVRQRHRIWKENTFLASSDVIPGMKRCTVKGITLENQSKMKLSFENGLKSFEDQLLSNFRDIYYDAHPNEMVFDSDGNLKNPIVTERRLHVGFHNSYEFVTLPIVDTDNDQSDLTFEGNLTLDRFQNESIPLVLILEYKIALEINKIEEEKGSLAKFMEKFHSSKLDPSQEIANEMEQLVMLGYSTLVKSDKKFVLGFDSFNKANPVSTFIYRNREDGSSEIRISFTLEENNQKNELKTENNEEAQKPLPPLPSEIPPSLTLEKRVENHIENIAPIPKPPVEIKKKEVEEDVEEVLEVGSNRSRSNSLVIPPPLSQRRTSISRKTKSRLLDAGFELYLDRFGNKPKVVVPGEIGQNSHIQLNADETFGENIKVQLMGISFTDMYKKKHCGIVPEIVSFSFQFYTFPCFSSENLKIYKGNLPPEYQKNPQHQRSSSTPFHFRESTDNSIQSFNTASYGQNTEEELLGIFYKVGQDGRPKCNPKLKIDDERPGATASFQMSKEVCESENLRYGKNSLSYYLGSRKLFLDMWDAETKFYLGQAAIDLKPLLLHGCSGVSCDFEVEVRPMDDLHQPGDDIAILYLRGYNFTCDETASKVAGSSQVQSKSEFWCPKPFIEIDLETKKLIQQTAVIKKEVNSSAHSPAKSSKIQRILNLTRNSEAVSINKEISPGHSSSHENDTLGIIQNMREMKKTKYVQKALRKQLTTTRQLDVFLGQGYYIEYIIENPYETEQNLEIQWEDSDLRILNNPDEIEYFKSSKLLAAEDNIITPKFNNQFQIYLKPREKSFVPFYYQIFDEPKSYIQGEESQENIPKLVLVSIRNSQGKDLQFLELIICFKNYFIDKTFQIFYDENQILQKSIVEKEPEVYHLIHNTLVQVKGEFYMKCSDPRVNCSTILHTAPNKSSYLEILFKFKTGNSIEVQNLFFVLYQDKYCSNVSAIWKICIHTVKRVDVNCIYGQSNRLSLVVRGNVNTKNVMCFPSNPGMFMIGMSGLIPLQANMLNEIPILLPPYSTHESRSLINIVGKPIFNAEYETKNLLYSWLVVGHYSLPPITKSFDIQIEKGKLSNKVFEFLIQRVSYTNPFLHKKSFIMRTDKPNLVQFKQERLELSGGETQYIGLRFLPCETLRDSEIMIFMNNDMDEIEECLQINVAYDQVKQLEKYCEFGAEQLISMNEFLKVISNAELEYGKALLRAVKPYKDDIKKLQEKVDKYPFYKPVSESSSMKSWEKMLNSYESLGSLHVESAEIFLNERKLIKSASKEIDAIFKEKFEIIKKGSVQLSDMISAMEKYYTSYKRELKDLDGCTAQYKKSLKDLKMSKKDMDKIKLDYDKQILASQEAVKVYRDSVIELNKFKNEYYFEILPQNHEALINSLKSGLEPPLDFNIADTSEVHSKKVALRSSSRDELRMESDSDVDFTKLSDKQGKKKAMEKIKSLDKEIIEVEKQRQGIDILKAAYKDSGNPLKTLECTTDQLNDVEVKLNQLLALKHKLHCYIATIDGKPLPEAPAFVGSPRNIAEKTVSSSSITVSVSGGSHTQQAGSISDANLAEPKKLKVLYDFTADTNSPEEMSVCAGDLVILVKENGDGWTHCKQVDGKEGFVPKSYLSFD
ncbi:Nephrocystin-4 [Boothiomyces sp. JEL0866]|nr:Nephrocystin-4 [Boothiomyces sp. JEL0866]